MKPNLTIDNLQYEELVLLQNVLWYVLNDTDFTNYLDSENRAIFDELYNKVMIS